LETIDPSDAVRPQDFRAVSDEAPPEAGGPSKSSQTGSPFVEAPTPWAEIYLQGHGADAPPSL